MIRKNCNEKRVQVIINDILTLNRYSDSLKMTLCWYSFTVQCLMRRVPYSLMIHNDNGEDKVKSRVIHNSRNYDKYIQGRMWQSSKITTTSRSTHTPETPTNENSFSFSVAAKDYGVSKH